MLLLFLLRLHVDQYVPAMRITTYSYNSFSLQEFSRDGLQPEAT
jgi:hypothetical protein